MSVYFVVQEQITDQEGVDAYLAAAGPTMANKRGRVLVFDPAVTPVEGDWHGERLVMIEFEDEAAFREWYDSPEYQAALPMRLASTDSRAALAKGLD
jgi:uncharacterized protein (DUF1330 family)